MNYKRPITRLSIVLLILALALVLGLSAHAAPSGQGGSPSVFINEIHYDNSGGDTGEAIEVAGPAGTDLTGWSIVLYNGNGGTVYDTENLSGVIPNQQGGFGTLSFPIAGIQNGPSDGIALVDPGSNVLQFLSYEGAVTAVGGVADGMTSTDIAVSESSSTPAGDSLQLTGTGNLYGDFTWNSPGPNTFGNVNTGQTFVPSGGNAPVVASCGGPLDTPEGVAVTQTVTASDNDGIVLDIVITNITPGPSAGTISLDNLVSASIVGGPASADITVDDLVPAGTYVVEVRATNDDDPSQSGICTLTVNVTSAPSGQLIINEIHADPASDIPPDVPGDANSDGVRDDSDDEFVEIVNNSGAEVDISGWTLSDGVGLKHTFPADTVVPDGCSVVVFGGGTPTGTFGNSVVQTASTGSLGLNNGGDTVTLFDSTAALVATYEYGSEGGNDQSLTRDPDITGPEPLVGHSTATGSGGALFSPGTMIDGTPFAGCPPPFVSIFDIQFTTDPSGDSPFVGQIVTTQGIVTGVFGNDVFIQDGTGPWNGLFLFSPNGPLNVGDQVEVTGEITEFFGLTQIASGNVTVMSSGNSLPAFEVLASGDVSQEQWEGVLVRVENATVTDENPDAPDDFGEWVVDNDSGGVRVDDLGVYSYAPTNGDALDFVQGPLHFSFGDFKIEPRNDNDIGVPPPPPPSVVTIMEIQGSDQFSAFAGDVVETSGVVTLFTADGTSFWLQDPNGDGDASTADGLFVSGGAFSAEGPVPVVGDSIRIIAQVDEQQFGNALPLTRLQNVQLIEVLSTGNPLPKPVELRNLPNVSIPDGIAFWEPLEGMLVSVHNARVVAPTSGFGEFAMLTRRDARLGSGFSLRAGQILIRNLGGNVVDYNPERIIVDDTTLAAPIVVRPRDRVRSLVGVVDYTFGNYKLQPASFEVTNHPLPRVPVSKRSGRRGNVTITTFNVENLFDLIDNPDKDDIGTGGAPDQDALDVQLAKLALAIELELGTPEIIVVQEVENTTILQELGDRVNTATGTDYVATSFETSDGRGIEVGFLWDDNRVDLLNAFQLDDSIVPGVSAAFGPASPSPGREPLVGVFEIEGEEVTIIGNHFKSKSGDDPLFGVNQPPLRSTEVQRKAQAQVVRDYVDILFNANPHARIMVTGDFNDFQFAEPGEGSDHPLAILEGGRGKTRLIDLIHFEPRRERFTFVFDGNSQVLDHMLVSSTLLFRLAAVDILHFNASFPNELESDATTPLRASDHDALEGRFKFNPPRSNSGPWWRKH